MSQEYCLLWIPVWWLCQTKSEWASWVQGLGSLFAVVVALHLPRASARRQVSQAKEAAEFFIRQLKAHIERCVELCKQQDLTLAVKELAVVQEVGHFGRGLSLPDLPGGIAEEVLAALVLTAKSRSELDRICEPAIGLNWQHCTNVFKGLRQELELQSPSA